MKKTRPLLWNTRMRSFKHCWFRGFLLFVAYIIATDYFQMSAVPVLANAHKDPLLRLSNGSSDAMSAAVTSSYTKLDNEGASLPDSATSWAMVRDNSTGLIWEAKHNMDGVSHYEDPGDADNIYTWYDSNPNTNGGAAGTPGNSNTNTEAFLKALNKTRLGGYSDWRLPTVQELAGLVEAGVTNPSINTVYFPNTVASWYWSSSTSVLYPHQAWGVGFRYGRDSYNFKYFYGCVRAVRGERSLASVPSVSNVQLSENRHN